MPHGATSALQVVLDAEEKFSVLEIDNADKVRAGSSVTLAALLRLMTRSYLRVHLHAADSIRMVHCIQLLTVGRSAVIALQCVAALAALLDP